MNELEKLIEIIKTGKSRNDVLIKFFGYSNKRVYATLDKIITDNNIDISHLTKPEICCLNCGKVITKEGKAFCGSSCSATYNNKKRGPRTNETKEKIRGSLIGKTNKPLVKQCVICSSEFDVRQIFNDGRIRLGKSNTCSSECKRELMIRNGKKVMEDLIASGRHKGWEKRGKRSYPEKFFAEVLDNNGIKYVEEYSIKQQDLGIDNGYNFFLDFYLEDKHIDLEIDGNQHKCRKDHDLLRDAALINAGYVVYRIPWKNINTENGKRYIKNEIDKFLEFYRTQKDVKIE